MEEDFLTIQEVAKLLRIGQRTTYDLARRGRLGGAIKVGNQWRVDRAAFRRWIEESEEARQRRARGHRPLDVPTSTTRRGRS